MTDSSTTAVIPRYRDTDVDATAIIVTYNSAADIGGLLAALPAALGGFRFRVLVVDNASADDTAAVVAGFPGAEFVPTGANLGYAGAINVGRQMVADSDGAILVLNPDTRPEPGSIALLLEALRTDSTVGAVVPKMVDSDGSLYPSLRREPSLLRAACDGLLGKKWAGRPGSMSEMVWDTAEYDRPNTIDWATGAVIAISGAADRAVGPWDERFFLYSEETDYSRRLREAGWTIRYEPRSVVAHKGGGSGQGAGLLALNTVNRVRYYRKYHSGPATASFRAVVLAGELLRVSRPGSRRAVRALVTAGGWRKLP